MQIFSLILTFQALLFPFPNPPKIFYFNIMKNQSFASRFFEKKY